MVIGIVKENKAKRRDGELLGWGVTILNKISLRRLAWEDENRTNIHRRWGMGVPGRTAHAEALRQEYEQLGGSEGGAAWTTEMKVGERATGRPACIGLWGLTWTWKWSTLCLKISHYVLCVVEHKQLWMEKEVLWKVTSQGDLIINS